jgi:hypothetical protein
VDYEKEIDRKLLDLFYQSIFYKKKEFEYVRVPDDWIYRYEVSKNYITKIVTYDGELIASLGTLIETGKVDNKTVKIGCFVDNCILPKYLDKYDEIFNGLFNEMENEMKERGVDVICGWDFLKNVNNHSDFLKNLGFSWVKGVNWFSTGISLNGNYPFKWKTKINTFWKTIFSLFKYYYKIRAHFIHSLPKGIILRNMRISDFKEAYNLINNSNKNTQFAPSYNFGKLKEIIKSNNIHGIVAEEDSKIIGILTYITTAWSGWMFGKPRYDKNWQIFFGFTPDEFAVLPEYQNSSLPVNMILYLMKISNPENSTMQEKDYSFVASVFNRKIKWRRDAFLKLGCTEPKFDHGVILAKSLREDIKLDKNKIWHLPARYILAPVPSTEELQRLSQQR